jgi:hypothetical protein
MVSLRTSSPSGSPAAAGDVGRPGRTEHDDGDEAAEDERRDVGGGRRRRIVGW